MSLVTRSHCPEGGSEALQKSAPEGSQEAHQGRQERQHEYQPFAEFAKHFAGQAEVEHRWRRQMRR